MKKYVIIGNGVAAAGCIEGIRTQDTASEITVISEENHPVYCRPLISYCLEGKTTIEKMNYREKDYYLNNGCNVLYGKQAIKIDDKHKLVITNSGDEIPYDELCIATGSSPFVPPFPGLETVDKKFSFMTIDDMQALEHAIDKNTRVFIVGAGLIGLKCAEGLADRVSEITVCDLADRILSSILDEECAALMQKHLEKHGIKFLLGDSVATFDKNTAKMNSGTDVAFDVLVLAVGVRANTALLKEIGGEVNRGILINDKMQTSIAHIYAAGDCTEGDDISSGQKKVLAILPNAYIQGKCAGINMAGGEAVFDNAIPMNSIGFFGLHAMTAGSYPTKQDGGEVYEEKGDSFIKRLYMKDGFLAGYILIGKIDRAGIYTSLIREKMPLTDIDAAMLKKSPSLAIFLPETRRKKLGGVL